MSSAGGLQGLAGMGIYCASKHAVIGLSKAAAKEVGSRNVRVNCVAPGELRSRYQMSAIIRSSVNGPENRYHWYTDGKGYGKIHRCKSIDGASSPG